jgi:hypothetical protein
MVVVFATGGLVRGQSRNAFNLLLYLSVYLGISPINVVSSISNWKDFTELHGFALADLNNALTTPTTAPAITTT